MYGLYINKKTRDEEVKKINANGKKVRKTSIRNQCLHPQYVVDFPNQEIKNDNEFGNVHYQTHFSVLYSMEKVY